MKKKVRIKRYSFMISKSSKTKNRWEFLQTSKFSFASPTQPCTETPS